MRNVVYEDVKNIFWICAVVFVFTLLGRLCEPVNPTQTLWALTRLCEPYLDFVNLSQTLWTLTRLCEPYTDFVNSSKTLYTLPIPFESYPDFVSHTQTLWTLPRLCEPFLNFVNHIQNLWALPRLCEPYPGFVNISRSWRTERHESPKAQFLCPTKSFGPKNVHIAFMNSKNRKEMFPAIFYVLKNLAHSCRFKLSRNSVTTF